MIKNYFKVAWRNLLRNKVSSVINIGGLATGMSVAILIGFWVYDELSFDKQFENKNGIAQVMENQAINGIYQTQKQIPIPVAGVLRTKFGSDFKEIILSSQTFEHIFSFNEKKFTRSGNFMEPAAPNMLTLPMLAGSRDGLKDPRSILLSSSLSKALFADADPIGQSIRLDDSLPVKVTGVYKDFPYNSSFRDISFIAPWELYAYADAETRQMSQEWQDNNWQVFVQLADHADVKKISAKIKTIKSDNDRSVKSEDKFKPTLFLFAMNDWHLYGEFTDGINSGGKIQYVRLIGLIGVFVLLLACINFMNLSTARSERRAKEVGIRKTVGSLRSQLVWQFFTESFVIAFFAFMLSILLVSIALPFFNELADKKISIPWLNPLLWLTGILVCLLTAFIAGSYPAFYLSSFKPIKVLKGVFRAGRFAALPRKVLVVTQFTVSIALVTGTLIVLKQIQYARNRPVGYDRSGLISLQLHTENIHNHFTAFRSELLATGTVSDAAEATSLTTQMGDNNGGLNWTGKEQGAAADNFAMKGVTNDYAKTIGLQFIAGRDFRTDSKGADALTMILSESTVKGMGLKEPIGKMIEWSGNKFTVIGVVKDMILESPYDPVFPTIFYLSQWPLYNINIRLQYGRPVTAALNSINTVFSKYNTVEPFDYKFVDQEFDAKFRSEQRVGKLAGFFAILAVFISCLGLFGLASFVAEQRTKEIGIRKVLGAGVFNIWSMLSKDFVLLILIACFVAIPISYFLLQDWLQQYKYRVEISWWLFAIAGFAAVIVTLLTVSYQSIKAALINPVKSLRSE